MGCLLKERSNQLGKKNNYSQFRKNCLSPKFKKKLALLKLKMTTYMALGLKVIGDIPGGAPEHF